MSDVDRLVAQINRRKRRAKKLGLPDALCDFYDKARCYPAWKNNQPLIVPNSLADLHGANDSVGFTYRGERYSLQLTPSGSMPDGESLGSIELQINEIRVLEICVSRYMDCPWCSGEVTAFVEGSWVKPFKNLAGEAQRLYERQAKIGFQNEDALRARFNIGPGNWFYWLTRIKDCLASLLK